LSVIFIVFSKKRESSLVISVSNDYGQISVLEYPWLSEALLIEPYHATLFKVKDEETGCEYAWQIFDSEGSEVFADRSGSRETDVWINSTGRFELRTTRICDNNERSAVQALYSKYVRRELTTLSPRDKEDFLDAMYVMYTTDTVTGQKQYGSGYRDAFYFTSVHVDAAGNPVCDEFHSGAGFLNNHLYMSNFFEQSLQLINPRTSLHFMEYPKYYSSAAFRNHLSNQQDGGNWTTLMTESWFGLTNSITGSLKNGRFAEVSVPYLTTEFMLNHGINISSSFFPSEESEWLNYDLELHLHSPYGLLRSPWNYNPSTFIGRFQNEAGIGSMSENEVTDVFMGIDCDDIYDFITTYVSGKSFKTYLDHVKDSSHISIHDNIGGQGGSHAMTVDLTLRSKYMFDDDDIIAVITATGKFMKKYVPQV
jgi:hypothetical protein